MARIILIINSSLQATYIFDDPRPVREVLVAINTGRLVPGFPSISLGDARLWAMAHRSVDVVTAVIDTPPVDLTPRLYEVLFGLADGKSPAQIAVQMGITRKTVYVYIRAIKDSFSENNLRKVLILADEYGFLD